jgi:hypothetical protein
MNIVLFISESNLVDRSDILTSTYSKPIANSIWQQQQSKVLPQIGTDAYNKMEELITNGTISSNTHYLAMLTQYIQPGLVSYVTADVLPRLNYKISSQGVITQVNETGVSVDLKTLQFLQERYSNEGDWFMTQLRRYMLEFQTEIPEFANPTAGDWRTILPDYSIPWHQRIYLKGQQTSWEFYDNYPSNGTSGHGS